MFKKNQVEAQASKSLKKENKDFAVAIITEGCNFEGKLYCKGATRIGGKVEGEIISEGLLIVEDSAKLFADIIAEDIIIQGSVQGSLEAKGRVELSSTSLFEGSIKTDSLVVQEGAKLNGTTSMRTSAPELKDSSKPLKEVKHKNDKVEVGEIKVDKKAVGNAPEIKASL